MSKSTSGKVFIAPIDVAYLKKMSDWSNVSALSDDEIRAEASRLAEYFQTRLKEEFRESKQQKFTILDSKDESDGVIEIAIVELVPTDVVRNVAGTIAGAFVPGGGLVSTASSGSIAIEGRVRKTATVEVVARFKDREKGRLAPIAQGGFTAVSHARNIIDDWSSQIVELLDRPPGAVISDSSPFTLKPW